MDDPIVEAHVDTYVARIAEEIGLGVAGCEQVRQAVCLCPIRTMVTTTITFITVACIHHRLGL